MYLNIISLYICLNISRKSGDVRDVTSDCFIYGTDSLYVVLLCYLMLC